MNIRTKKLSQRSAFVLFIAVLLLCAPGICNSGHNDDTPKNSPSVKRVVHALMPEGTAESRDQHIRTIERILGELPPESREYQNGAAALGRLHTDKASRILIKYLTVSGSFTGGHMPLESYPCAFELSRLGSVAFPAIFHKLDRDCSELELNVLAHVILHIDGRELAETRLRIEMRPQIPLNDPRARSVNRRTDRFRENARRVLDLLSDPKFVSREIALDQRVKDNASEH